MRCEPLEERQLLSFDPGLDWATYLGGSGSDRGQCVAVDAAGNTLVTGSTQSADLAGATPNSYHGGIDAFVAKVKPDGSLAWVTYLGGTSDDFGMGIALDGAGNVLVTGTTYSSDFERARANNSSNGGTDAFVANLSVIDGSVVWATYLGGSGQDQGYAIAVDRAGNALVTGPTYSSDFTSADLNGTVECNLFHGMKKGRYTSVPAGVGCASAEYEEIADRVSQGNG